ncbi:T9SS type A sorting domain-containing protein [Flavobacterium quisquiliarum]|uniref:T9SS type A sorting domain-containing protein n=1 Tax=Flavobacterium quisquiliarum TaxID=1834436 RepID=A0ABV8VZZ5_9FLAO|nr:T9SS type A sorting domain-containing protein [Flavobacterium quisquiliarum]MBW1653841.1 T9SS type A sorting domain-containing protein [Flavobacterium quisquiliarum]NWL01570.1 T9SS C-terminal target domain-containing protein [Flavobacterium collinsii]
MKYILHLLLLMPFYFQAQNKVLFTYDTAGNQITRVLCLNCTSKVVKEVQELEALTETELEKFFPEDVISYYPNPVREELYLQWQVAEENYVSSISIYSMTGQLLRNFQIASSTNRLNIPFQQYSTGVYLVLFSYKDGDEKTIKIIKK